MIHNIYYVEAIDLLVISNCSICRILFGNITKTARHGFSEPVVEMKRIPQNLYKFYSYGSIDLGFCDSTSACTYRKCHAALSDFEKFDIKCHY